VVIAESLGIERLVLVSLDEPWTGLPSQTLGLSDWKIRCEFEPVFLCEEAGETPLDGSVG
jgi:hypothetical protein